MSSLPTVSTHLACFISPRTHDAIPVWYIPAVSTHAGAHSHSQAHAHGAACSCAHRCTHKCTCKHRHLCACTHIWAVRHTCSCTQGAQSYMSMTTQGQKQTHPHNFHERSAAWFGLWGLSHSNCHCMITGVSRVMRTHSPRHIDTNECTTL